MSAREMEGALSEYSQAARLRTLLDGLLPAPQVERLLTLWQACQAQASHCSVPLFVERVARDLGLDARQADSLRLKLFSAVLERRAPPPRVAVPRPIPVPRRADPEDPPAQVFLALLRELDSQVKARFPDRWSTLCAALVRRLQGEVGLRAPMGQLLCGDTASAELAAGVHDEATRQALVHHYYLALCEVLGPVPADRLLSDAVGVVERQPAAARYAPRRLL